MFFVVGDDSLELDRHRDVLLGADQIEIEEIEWGGPVIVAPHAVWRVAPVVDS